MIPAEMLAGDGVELQRTLLGSGFWMKPGRAERSLVQRYIVEQHPSKVIVLTDRIGWHGEQFVLPDRAIGCHGEEVRYQSTPGEEPFLAKKGTISSWREQVARLCIGNSRLSFAVSAAFVGPLLRLAGTDGGGVHFRGSSSSGKTTILHVAASALGSAKFIQRWRATDNAIEAIAAQRCDLLLLLDELAQVDPRVAGEILYLLANGVSKARSTRSGQNRPLLTWLLFFVSAGEIGLETHMAEVGKRARAGQELRMAEIPADAGSDLGVFEDLHGYEHGAAFADALGRATREHHGVAGELFLEWVVANRAWLIDNLQRKVEELVRAWIPETASGQVHRVARRFALVAVAGELATEQGITGWPIGEASAGVKKCLDAWITVRGGLGIFEDRIVLRQIRRFLQEHSEGRFSDWSRSTDEHAPRTLNRAGYRKSVRDKDTGDEHWEYFIFKEVFQTEVAQGHDLRTTLRALRDRGCLVPDKDRSFDCRVRPPKMPHVRCYRVTSKIFEADLDD